MIKSSNSKMANSEVSNSSAFAKQTYLRGVAIVGTSGLVFGLGLAGSTPAFAVAPFTCTANNTATPQANPSLSRAEIVEVIDYVFDNSDGTVQICLDGNFTINSGLEFGGRDFHFYGTENSSIQSQAPGGVFNLDSLWLETDYQLTIENLLIQNSSGDIPNPYAAVTAEQVNIRDSTFSGNTYGAVYGRIVDVSDSTFVDNTSEMRSGGAIIAEESAEIGDSTFEGNISEGSGGAIYVGTEDQAESNILYITNSTFLDNSANSGGGAIFSPYTVITNSTFVENSAFEGGAVSSEILVTHNSTFVGNSAQTEGAEGGALYSSGAYILFSTFLNNEAPDLSGGPGDTPGNAIYRYFSPAAPMGISLVGNIFAGSSNRAQIGIGDIAAPVSDLGGNVFSTSSETEEDLTSQDPSSVFGASLVSIFGTNSPELLSHEPNLNGTQTVAPSPGSVALDIVPSGIFQEVIDFLDVGLGLNSQVDQRGAPRTNPADAGAFEGSVTPSLATTGSTTPWWAVWSSAAMLAIGGLAMAYAKRSRRRIR